MTDKNPTPSVPMDFQDVFRELVLALQPRNPVTRGMVQIYYDTLSTFSIEVLQESARTLRRSCTFFPSTGEWFDAAANVVFRGRERAVSCRCLGRGLIRVNYKSGEPFDLAICSCADASFYRSMFRTCRDEEDTAAVVAHIRDELKIGVEHQVAYIEAFDDPDDPPIVPVLREARP